MIKTAIEQMQLCHIHFYQKIARKTLHNRNKIPFFLHSVVLFGRILAGHSGRKKFCSIFLQKTLTDLNTNFTKFEFFAIFIYQDIAALISSKNGFFPLKALPVLPIKNDISKTHNSLHVLDSKSSFMQSYCQNKEKVQNRKISYFFINVSQLSKS